MIQRPASVIKELVENAVDAGATDIRINVKDAGKTLIQVIDNGCGMSETDARMAFERHATSKIRRADDLFYIADHGIPRRGPPVDMRDLGSGGTYPHCRCPDWHASGDCRLKGRDAGALCVR